MLPGGRRARHGCLYGKNDESHGPGVFARQKPIFEINGGHPIFGNLNALYEKDAKSPLLEEWVKLLFDQALIAEGQMVKDPLAYSKRVNELLVKVSGEAIKG